MPRTLSALRKGPRLAAWGPSGHRCGLASHSTPGASWLFPSPGVPGILEAVPWALGAGSSPDRGRQAQLLPAGTRGQGASPGKGTGKCRRPCEERLLARPVLPAPHVQGGQKHQSTSLQLGIAGSVGTGPLPARCPRSHCFCPLRDAQRAWSAGVCGSDLLETSSPGSPSLGGRLPKPSTGAQGHCIAVPRGFLLTPTEQPFSSRGQ